MKKLLVTLLFAAFLGTSVAVAAVESGLVNKDDRPTNLIYVEPEDGTTPYFEKRYVDDNALSDKPLNLITFTDTHFDDGIRPEDVITLTAIERTVQNKKPDLVVFTGDVCLGTNPMPCIDKLAKIFEDNKTYWAVILGNHDGEPQGGPTREELIRYYESKPYSLTKKGPLENSNGNYMVNHVTTKGITQTLVFFDSGAGSISAEDIVKYNVPRSARNGYDFIKPEAHEWYKTELNNIKEANDGVMPNSIVFMHIPVPEHNNVKSKNFNYGVKLEPSCPSKYNSGTFQVFKDVGSTKVVVCGHDHINSYAVEYEGIKLMYSLSSSFGSYHSRNNVVMMLAKSKLSTSNTMYYTDGHTEFTVNADGSVIDTPCYNELNPEIFAGLEEEFKQANIKFVEIK